MLVIILSTIAKQKWNNSFFTKSVKGSEFIEA